MSLPGLKAGVSFTTFPSAHVASTPVAVPA